MSDERLRFLGVAVCDYDARESWPPLRGAQTDVERLRDALAADDAETVIVSNPTTAGIAQQLKDIADELGNGRWHGDMVVVWAGHGTADDALRLVLRDSAARPSEDDSLAPDRLVANALRSGADQLLLVLDTCHAGAGLGDAITKAIDVTNRQTFPAGSEPWIGINAATDARTLLDDANSVGHRLHKLLTSGPEAPTRVWSEHEELIDGDEVMKVIGREWPTDALPQQATLLRGRAARGLLRNPLYAPGAAERRVAPEAGPGFVGREGVLERMAAWAAGRSEGLLAVIGTAGMGKSTLLERFASERAGVLVVSATRRTVWELVGVLAPRLGAADLADVDALAEHLRERGGGPLIVVDALDEARPGEALRIVDDVLVALSEVTRVVTATRPVEAGGASIDAVLAAAGTVIDLDADADLLDDLRRFVLIRLEAGDS